MFTKKNLFALLVITLTLGFVSCSDDKHDTEEPEITLLAPANEDSFAPGSSILIEALLTSEAGIASYKIDIHWAGGHSHSRSITDEVPNRWEYTTGENNLNGQKTVNINHTTTIIPETTEVGAYHLGIIAVDIHGKEARTYIEIDIE